MTKPFSPARPWQDRGRAAPSATKPVRVMLVDDSLVVRSILERILSANSEISVTASVASAAGALDHLRRERVDVILLDIEMPGRTGLAALPDIIALAQGARVLILSSNCEEGGPAAVEALSLGACDTLTKPGRGSFAGRFGTVLGDRILHLGRGGRIDPVERQRVVKVNQAARDTRIGNRRKPGCILIGSSTGGIAALNIFLGRLNDAIAAPILLTQHLPSAFMPFFATQLRGVTKRMVVIAEDGMVLAPNHIYLAPGDAHLTVADIVGGARIVLARGVTRSGCCPSVDPMFETAGDVFGPDCVALILSGMGRDGTEGAARVRAKHGIVIAQEPDSCVVWGMPGAVVNAGHASAVLSPLAAADFVNRSAVEPARSGFGEAAK